MKYGNYTLQNKVQLLDRVDIAEIGCATFQDVNRVFRGCKINNVQETK